MCLAIPGRVLSLDEQDNLMREGRVAFAGIVKRINLACVPQARVGDYVLVHAGFAITVVDEARAMETLAELGLNGAEGDGGSANDDPSLESDP